MAEREYGPPCPGCTVEIINRQIERSPRHDFSTCTPCRDHGALFHAHRKTKQVPDAQERSRRKSGIENGEANAQG